MENDHFEEFLAGVDLVNEDFIVEPSDITGNGIEGIDEVQSVNRFRSLVNSPPSLLSLSIASIVRLLNEQTCDHANNDQVRAYWNEHVEVLPVDVKLKIKSQCSLSTMCCVYRDAVWDQDPTLIAAAIKQEEDMLRYLYWKEPTSPLLRHFERLLTIEPLIGQNFELVSGPEKALPEQIKASLAEPLHSEHTNPFLLSERIQTNNLQQFKREFDKTTCGLLTDLNWSNVLVVGGAVLGSVLAPRDPGELTNPMEGRDIDIYIYGLSLEAAQKKVEEIYKSIQKRLGHPIGIYKTANTLTLVASGELTWRERAFKNVQIILSTYASPLEVLLSSDMNSCSVAFDGERVLAIPRFVFGMMYKTNFLDSSTKFGSKLRWERIAKYYQRGFDIVAPLHLRVHGYGSFASAQSFMRGSVLHPNTVQMIELMSLLKLKLMSQAHGVDSFGVLREQSFQYWPVSWMKGVAANHQLRIFRANDEDEHYQSNYALLRQLLTPLPPWVVKYFRFEQDLSMPRQGIREPPKYSEDGRVLDSMKYDHNDSNYDPNKRTDIENYMVEHCRFDTYNESSLQCFHMNFFVDKQQKAANPYREMNTHLMSLNYRVDKLLFDFDKFRALMRGQEKSIEQPFVMHNMNWTLKITHGSPQVTFISLTKEDDDYVEEHYNRTHRPHVVYANFYIAITGRQRSVILDGSQVFTYTQPHNMWLTWVRNDYFQGAGTNNLGRFDPEWEVAIQLLEPAFNITT